MNLIRNVLMPFLVVLLFSSSATVSAQAVDEAIGDSSEKKNAYETPTEEFSVSKLSDGYSLSDAKRLHDDWSLTKFLDITEAGAYSYLNLQEFMPHTVIRRDGPVTELEKSINATVGALHLENEKHERITFDDIVTSEESPVQGVMVVHRGRIAYENYPGMRSTDNHVWMSNAKIVAGLLIALFEEEGLIDSQEVISKYLPQTKGTAWESVKVIDVLNMQSGLDLEETPATRKGATPYSVFVASELGNPSLGDKVLTHDEALLRIPKHSEPGQAFEYSSANTQLLCLLIEAVGNKRIGEIITERIWSHAGMTGDATLALSPQGNGIIHGLISSRLEDMAKYGLLHTPSWELIASKRVVPETVLKKMQTSGVEENYLKGALGPRLTVEFRERPAFNSYQWDAVFADGDLYKSGMNGQGIYVSPAKDIVIVWFATGFTEIPMEAYSRVIAKTLK